MAKIDTTNVSTKDLAEILGMSRDGVTRLNRQGVIQQNGRARGKYNLFEAVDAYLTYLRENKGDETNVKLIKERERKLRLQNDKVEDTLVSVEEAAQAFAPYVRTFREIVMGNLEDMAAKISKTDSPREVANILQAEIQATNKAIDDGLLEAFDNERKN